MNKYIPATEKERLIRIFILHELLKRSINEYTEHDTDKTFMGNLKRGKTFLKKALDYRLSFLDKFTEQKLVESINKVGFAFLPKNEARRELEKLQKLQSVYPIDKNAMHDWVEFTIENACRGCKRCDFTECQGRKIMMELDIAVNDGTVVGGCQYRYEEAEK